MRRLVWGLIGIAALVVLGALWLRVVEAVTP